MHTTGPRGRGRSAQGVRAPGRPGPRAIPIDNGAVRGYTVRQRVARRPGARQQPGRKRGDARPRTFSFAPT